MLPLPARALRLTLSTSNKQQPFSSGEPWPALLLPEFYSSAQRRKARRQVSESGNNSGEKATRLFYLLAFSRQPSIHPHSPTSNLDNQPLGGEFLLAWPDRTLETTIFSYQVISPVLHSQNCIQSLCPTYRVSLCRPTAPSPAVQYPAVAESWAHLRPLHQSAPVGATSSTILPVQTSKPFEVDNFV